MPRIPVFTPANLLVSCLAVTMVGASAARLAVLSAADLTAPRPQDRQVTRIVQSLMERQHLSGRPLDDEISRRTLKRFLDNLDPMKMYFYQADVDQFTKQRDDLDDMLKNGDVSFCYTVYKKLQQRVSQAMKLADELLQLKHDFTADEHIVIERDRLRYFTSEQEARERWRKRIKYDLLMQKREKVEGQDAVDRLSRRYRRFARQINQTDSSELLEMYLSAMTASFDPHSSYLSPDSLANQRIEMGLQLEGIGAALQYRDGHTVISRIVPGSAADKHGKLKPEDRIVSIGQGERGEMVNVRDMNLADVVRLIRGPTGTIVRLGVIPAGENDPLVYNISRGSIQLKDSQARGEIIEAGKKPDGSPHKIGVIHVPRFYGASEQAKKGQVEFNSVARDVTNILNQFNNGKVDAVILDLRNSEGQGLLQEAVAIAGLFLDQGPVVQVKGSDARVQQLDDLQRGMVWDGPLVVLTSRFTSGAAEIVAGAVQDHHRGLIVGDKITSGKGTVQELLDLGSLLFRIPRPPNLGGLNITTKQLYRPGGDGIQLRGISADVVLPSLANHMDVGETELDYALAFDRVAAAEFTPLALVRADWLQRLRAASQSRQDASDQFAALQKNIARYLQRKELKSVPLNEKLFLAQTGPPDSGQPTAAEATDSDRDFYFQEVLAITLDYMAQLQPGE